MLPRCRRRRIGRRLIEAMAVDRATLGASQAATPPAILREPRPGDMGWVVQSHGTLYAQRVRLRPRSRRWWRRSPRNSSPRSTPSRERCWIADIDGAPVGSVFLVRHRDDVAKAALAAGRSGRARTGIGPAAGRTNASRFARHAAIARSRCGPRAFWSPRARFIRTPDFVLVATEPHRSFGQSLIGETWELQL